MLHTIYLFIFMPDIGVCEERRKPFVDPFNLVALFRESILYFQAIQTQIGGLLLL